MMRVMRTSIILALAVALAAAQAAAAEAIELRTPHLRLAVSPADGRYSIEDVRGGVTWASNPGAARFGQAVLRVGGSNTPVDLSQCAIERQAGALLLTFRPLADRPEQSIQVKVEAGGDGSALRFSCESSPGLDLQSIRLLDEALAVRADEKGYIIVPVRLGLLIPADSGRAFSHRFDTYAYEGCHMAMLGIVKAGAAAMITWDDCYPVAEIRSATPAGQPQVLTTTLELRRSARSFTLTLLGKGDYVSIGSAYREVARQRGWLVSWDQKLEQNPDRARLFGASNFKLWSMLTRRMNEESTQEESSTVNWTFEQAAQIAEHLRNDLKLERVHFIIGGWIRRGYDNQHPDILPAAPELGGDEKLAEAARRIMALGYLFDMHDNYQDMYRDSPSWDESYLMRTSGGGVARGGRWAGGRAWLTCSQRALDLARRPQNLPAVKKLTGASAYFIDTTYAAGLAECFHPDHPLTRADDMKWKQALSDYAREVFGIFGSECGREWAIPHSDYFEGMTGVSGGYYHDKGLVAKVGGSVVPLFEIVYRDCIAMYGKYGYDMWNSSEYVLHHIAIGRTLNYHSIPRQLYWKQDAEANRLQLGLSIAEARQTGPRRLEIVYEWDVEQAPADDWAVFVHFVDGANQIRFQGDYRPPAPTSGWPAGKLRHGPMQVMVPDGLSGTFDIRAGLWKQGEGGRATLRGTRDREQRVMLGQLKVGDETIEYIPPARTPGPPGDPALFVRGDGGWSAGMHPMDRFLKNTHEVLSPLAELTARMRMTGHQFLSADRRIQRTVFGDGQVEVIVNASALEHAHQSGTWGQVLLPPYGFLVESPQFVAFCAVRFNDVSYNGPSMFTLRSLDGAPIGQSGRVRIINAFGEGRIRLGAMEHVVGREQVVPGR
jgi:hypothetical protein